MVTRTLRIEVLPLDLEEWLERVAALYPDLAESAANFVDRYGSRAGDGRQTVRARNPAEKDYEDITIDELESLVDTSIGMAAGTLPGIKRRGNWKEK